MAQLVVAAAGAAIGYQFEQQAIGWAVGSVVGGMLFGPKGQDIEGPRLQDLKVQTSTYGSAIPIEYGAYRLTGNVIYSTDLIETVHEEEQGKGGGGATSTTYTYSVSCAVGVCEGPVAGIRRIWANGKLIYDSFGGDTEGDYTALNVYLGNETQMPDPFWEGYHGAGKVPAHRGLCYVSIENLQLADFGNRTPNFSFEVAPAASQSSTLIEANNDLTFYVYNPVRNEMIGYVKSNGSNVTNAYVVDVDNGSTLETLNFSIDVDGQKGLFNPIYNHIYLYLQSSGSYAIGVIDAETNDILSEVTGWFNSEVSGTMCVDTDNGKLYQIYLPSSGSYGIRVLLPSDFSVDNFYAIAYENSALPIDIGYGDGKIYVVARETVGSFVVDTNLYEIDKNDFTVISKTYIGTNINYQGIAYDSSTNSMWVSTQYNIYKFSIDSNSIVQTIDIATDPIVRGTNLGDPADGQPIKYDALKQHIWIWGEDADYNQYGIVYEASTGARCAYVPISQYENPEYLYDITENINIKNNGHALFNDGYFGNFVDNYATCGGGNLILSDIITDICGRVGITASQLNFSSLNDESVIGYAIGKSMTARSALEPLQTAFYFDAVESDNKLSFVSRGRDIVVSIPDYDLGASNDGNAAPVEITTTMESEMPSKVSVTYPSYVQDYEPNTQQTFRVSGNSLNQVNLELPIVLNDEKAKQVANVNLFAPWIAKRRFKFSTSRKYSYLEPTDIVEISNNGFFHIVRIISKDESNDGVLNFEAVAEKANVYTQSSEGAGSADGFVPQTVKALPDTYIEMMDINALQDDDVNTGFYYAATGEFASNTVKNWRGATIYKSVDNRVSYTSWATILFSSPIGVCDNVLGGFEGGNVFDELNYVDVTLYGGGELVSQSEINVLNYMNVAIVGNEIIQFKNAELIGENSYRLSGLLRGRRGSEYAINSHVSNERFVFVDKNSWKRAGDSAADLYMDRHYVGVTSGGYLTDSLDNYKLLNNKGNAIKPYSPSHLGGGRDDDGNLYVTWIRRNNKFIEWMDNADVPMTEQVEKYFISIYDGVNLINEYESLDESFTYTDAMQIADFGSLQSSVKVRVAQFNAIVGRGNFIEGIL